MPKSDNYEKVSPVESRGKGKTRGGDETLQVQL
jgi:hypothetical protein